MSVPYTEPTLADFLKSVWGARFYILVFAALFFLIGLLIVFVSTPLYRASMIVAPADGYALGDYASSVSEGKSMELKFWRPKDQEGVSTDFYRFIYTIQGTAVANILLKDESVLAGLAKDRNFSSASGRHTPEELAAYLAKYVRVEHMGTTPLRRIGYRHSDPAFAAAFLRKIHLVSDQLIRRDRRQKSESRIRYLEGALQKTVNPDHRKGIAALLIQQEHIQMLANLDEAYAAIVVEAPSSSPKPVWPDKMLVLSVLAILGGMVGYLIRMVRYAE